MVSTKRMRAIVPAILSTLALTAVLIPASLTSAHTRHASAPIYLTAFHVFHPTGISKDFNPFDANTNDLTLGAVYEPLMIITPASGGHQYPWLATGYTYADGGKTLIVTIRSGVRWSDGQPMTAKDVVFTYNYGKKYPVADQDGLWAGKFLSSVSLMSSNQVAFHLTAVNSTLLPRLLSDGIKILPAHVWSTVTDPSKFSDPNLVGTGPFARLASFSSQEYILGKNPYYWQAGKPTFDGIRVPALADNTSADALRAQGKLDWGGNFVADIQHTYIAKDPAHNHYYFAPTNPLGLWFNDERYPFSLPAFRKALSYAIDRNKISAIGENGYEPAADVLGLKLGFPSWYDKSLDAQATDLATYNPAKAKAALAAAGFKLQNGVLYDPKGQKVSMQISVPNSWSDWVLSVQIIVQGLKQLGIDAGYKGLIPDNWFAQSDRGQIDAHIHWTNYGVNPYYVYESYMSQETYTPTGQDASLNGGANWERYVSPEATKLFAQFRATTDLQKQHAIINQIERIQLRDMPFIPIMYSADWYEYSTARFTGWPTKDNFYVRGSINDYPDRTMVLTTIKPVS